MEEVGKKSFIRKHWKIGLGGIILLSLAFAGALEFLNPSGESENPQFIQADFIDLSRIDSISKFRSGSGHDFSKGKGETCRSMKHYFNTKFSEDGQKLRDANNNIPPGPDGVTDISIFSPVDGKIISVQKEKMPIGEQIYIRPDSKPTVTIRLFHIYLDDGFAKGTKVKAGEKIGKIGQYSNTDIALEKRGSGFLSYFDAMPDSLFVKYQARGVKERSDLIYSKEYRDANPLQCNGENFAINTDGDPNSGNFVTLSGK